MLILIAMRSTRNPMSSLCTFLSVVCLATALILILPLSTLTQQYRPLDHLGKPDSIETGTEVYPLNKGFLQCAVDTLNPVFRHGSTAQVFDQLSTKPNPASTAVIVGHGMSGIQCTGNADNCAGSDDSIVMGDYNFSYWQSHAIKIRSQFESLSLVGCEIGQDTAGATFLSQMADTIQRPVRGPDSIIFCGPDGLVFDDGGQWVEAMAGKGPPTPHPAKRYRVEPSVSFEFKINGTKRQVSPSQVNLLSFQHRTIHQREFQTIRLEFSSLVKVVGLGRPFETRGRPAAIVTGNFFLRIRINDHTVDRGFILYNDVLVEDMVEQDVFYRVDRVQLTDYIVRAPQ